ncbi:DedA family protein, partial [Kineococcus glutinatus]|uniref:DedA family protein n=1 Tax=Kineococcus glutinatus TaxID=1070872 RepID=UPI0031F01449
MSSALLTTTAAAAQEGASGLTGLVLDVVERLGPVGVGVLGFLEVVFPPIPSEVVLPLAGYLVQQGRMALLPVVLLSLVGTVAGSFVLYWLGAALGRDRLARLVDGVPLLTAHDLHRAFGWFDRHASTAVFTGRFIPGVRSFISLPAGASQMSLLRFGLLTVAGSALWNGALIALGLALGTQYELVERYSQWLDYAVYAALALLVGRG